MNLNENQILQVLMSSRTRLSAAAWLVTRDAHAAEDVFQNVALKAMTREVTFDSEAALLSWAFITARREAIDYSRRRRLEVSRLDEDVMQQLEKEWQIPSGQPAGARLEALQRCLDTAPDSARQMLRLRYFEGYSCEEVAERMQLGVDAVYKRLSRLHQSLRLCIDGKLRNGGIASLGEL